MKIMKINGNCEELEIKKWKLRGNENKQNDRKRNKKKKKKKGKHQRNLRKPLKSPKSTVGRDSTWNRPLNPLTPRVNPGWRQNGKLVWFCPIKLSPP